MTIDDIKRAYHVRPGYWFAPKLFGYGAVPVMWQGWALTLATMGALIAAIRFLPTDWEKAGVAIAILVPTLAVMAEKTDGGWHWRWGPRGD